ncbi:MAG: HD domain-containing protein [Bacilli bacterium]|nr:HD domain-containing protein [Bacilli bacterium]
MEKEAKLYILFDMLGDLVRSGPIQWKVDRFRTEDVKDHIFDLILMVKLIKPYLPDYIDTNKMIDYAIVHDLEEVITGDITTFEGVTKEEKERVNKIAMDYLISEYGNILNINKLFNDFENKFDIEAKVLHMLDKVSSSISFLKYDNENKVDMDNPMIVECLRTNPGVVKLKEQGLSLGEIFYVWHLRSVNFNEEEIIKYNISKKDAKKIVEVIKQLMESIHNQIQNINQIKKEFPKEATIYRNINNNSKKKVL